MLNEIPLNDAPGRAIAASKALLAANPSNGNLEGARPERLAEEVKNTRRAHRKCVGAGRRSLDCAQVAGESLVRLKALVPHGEWYAFVRKTFRGQPSLRMVQNYIRIAEGWPALLANAKPVSHLGIREALRLLAKRSPSGPLPPRFPDSPVERDAPPPLGQLAAEVLGEIDLDPCSNPHGALVLATYRFTPEEAGLERAWRGRVFLQPPGGRELPRWIAKLRAEYPERVDEALVLMSASTDVAALAELAEFAGGFAFLKRHCHGLVLRTRPQPYVLAYVGQRVATFVAALDDHALLLFPRP